jgi:hypothetical protein
MGADGGTRRSKDPAMVFTIQHYGRAALFVTTAALALAMGACRNETPQQPPATGAAASGKTTTAPAGAPQDLGKAKIDMTLAPSEGFFDSGMIGTKLGPDGNVAVSKAHFSRNEPIYVTLRFRESPKGLQASVRIFTSDESEEPTTIVPKEMKGEKVATFKIPKLKPGRYVAAGYWGGNRAADFPFDIR